MEYAAIRSCSVSINASWVQKGLGKARLAVARKRGIRLCIMLRDVSVVADRSGKAVQAVRGRQKREWRESSPAGYPPSLNSQGAQIPHHGPGEARRVDAEQRSMAEKDLSSERAHLRWPGGVLMEKRKIFKEAKKIKKFNQELLERNIT